jgi:hypothetical protein
VEFLEAFALIAAEKHYAPKIEGYIKLLVCVCVCVCVCQGNAVIAAEKSCAPKIEG